MPYLSVVLTNYNESPNIQSGVLDELVTYLRRQKFTWELVMVDDGSTDDTLSLLRQFSHKISNVRVIGNPHMGKAAGVITGALAATGEHILFTDVDQATPIDEFDKFISQFTAGAQVIIGSRANRKGAPLFRQILAYGQVLMRLLILRLPFKDTQCGFKAFTRQAALQIFTIMKSIHPLKPVSGPSVNPGFDLELLYLGRKLGYKIVEVPVTWHYKTSERVNFVDGVISGIKEMLIVRLRAFHNVYNI